MVFDILFLVFIGLGFYAGYRKGFIYSIFSLLGWFLGLIAALKFSYLILNFLHAYVHLSPKMLAILAFVIIFIMVLLIFRIVGWALENLLKTFSLNLPNQILGGLVHSLVGLYVLCVLIWFLDKLDVIPKHQKETSYIYPYAGNLGPKVVETTGKIIPLLHDTFDKFDGLLGGH